MVTTIEYALMAGASYRDTRPDVNKFPTPGGWNMVSRNPQDGSSGFEAAVFQRGTEIVISFAGTDFSWPFTDFTQANIPLASGTLSSQLKQAADYYLAIKAVNPGATITLTGHSLGGGLASLIAVLFDEKAVTFDQAPFRNAALVSTTTDETGMSTTYFAVRELRTYLTGRFPPSLLTKLDAYLDAAESPNANTTVSNTLAGRESKVTDINVNGEVLGYLLLSRIGSQADIANSHDGLGVLGGVDLHSQALLAAFLQSDPNAASNTDVSAKTLNRVTYKLPDLLKMIFDKKLFAYPVDKSNTSNPNFLELIVNHEAGRDPRTGASITADEMVTRFTADLWKLAQDGGLTMTDGNEGNADLHQVSNALIAFAMQKYYKEKDTSVGYKAALFTDETGGIRFDMAAISEDFKNSFDANLAIDLSQAKGYVQYFDKYLETTVFSPQERALIRSSLPWMRDWYVQAGATSMIASDTENRGAFMLGGSGSDALTGGAANNLLVGNAGADTLKGGTGVDLLIGGADNDILEGGGGSDTLIGGQGSDIYKFTSGDGWDTVIDSDGRIEYDGIPLDGGQAVGNSGMVWQKKDGQGKVQFTYILTNWTEGTETYQRLSIQGTDGGLIVKGWNPGQLGITLAGAPQITPPPVANPKVSNTSDFWYASTHTILDGSEIGIATTAAVGAYGEVWANGNLIGNDFDNLLLSYAENDTLSGGKGRDVLLAGLGNDQLKGGDGDDALSSGDGDDLLEGNANNDVIAGGIGRDVLIGGDGADALFGGAALQAIDSGWSVIYGATNVFTLDHFDGGFNSVGDGDDQLLGGIGNDFLSGGWGNDALNGEGDNDYLIGDAGDDILVGGAGTDSLHGDGNESDFPDGHLPNHYAGTPAQYHGNDFLDGGANNDRLFGEPPQKCSSRILRSTEKNGQKRKISGPFGNADNIYTLQSHDDIGLANVVVGRVSSSLVSNDTQWRVEA